MQNDQLVNPRVWSIETKIVNVHVNVNTIPRFGKSRIPSNQIEMSLHEWEWIRFVCKLFVTNDFLSVAQGLVSAKNSALPFSSRYMYQYYIYDSNIR